MQTCNSDLSSALDGSPRRAAGVQRAAAEAERRHALVIVVSCDSGTPSTIAAEYIDVNPAHTSGMACRNDLVGSLNSRNTSPYRAITPSLELVTTRTSPVHCAARHRPGGGVERPSGAEYVVRTLVRS
jgi:hypothetical protein